MKSWQLIEVLGKAAQEGEQGVAEDRDPQDAHATVAIGQCAARTTRHLRWFEVTQWPGKVEDGEIRHDPVMMKVGFTPED